MEPKRSKLERVAIAVKNNPEAAAGAVVGVYFGGPVGAVVGAGVGKAGKFIWDRVRPGE